MKNKLFISLAGVLVLALLFYFGKTTSEQPMMDLPVSKKTQSFDIQSFINSEKAKQSELVQQSINNFEKNISEKHSVSEKAAAILSLADYYKDSVQLPEAYLYFISEAAKLDNSEKNLTFAAQLFLSAVRAEQDNAKMDWESDEAIMFFEKAIELNPNNDDLKIGLGSCYIFGKGRSGDPQQTMRGVQELLGVVRKDSNNLKAQLVLGIGGYVSGQYDKAIVRLLKVVDREPKNLEAIAFLADTYAAKGMKEDAVKWYQISKRLADDPHYSKEVDDKIKQLR